MSIALPTAVQTSPDWLAAEIATVPTCDENGAPLVERALLVATGIKRVLELALEWQTTNNTLHIEWAFSWQMYRNATSTGMIMVLEMRHEDEAHDFKLDMDWVADTIGVEKIEYCICAPPQRVSTGA